MTFHWITGLTAAGWFTLGYLVRYWRDRKLAREMQSHIDWLADMLCGSPREARNQEREP